jgi:CD2 antigen cytoplasmic tail-binding protein 2
LAPDEREDDAVLDADVIGGGASTKRNAVNIDGYDSDSDNDEFNARAEARAKVKGKDVSLADELDHYGEKPSNKGQNPEMGLVDDDDDDDMFGHESDVAETEDPATAQANGNRKSVKFLDVEEIQGQVLDSKSGGHVSANFALDPKGKLSTHAMDDEQSSDDEEDAALAAEEEGLDEEVGAGGLKRNAPKIDAFNLRAEQDEGRFDDAGNFVRKAGDPDAVHDSWLEGLTKKEMKRAREAHEKREAERAQRARDDDALLTSDILRTLILHLEKGETVLEALARLGKGRKKEKKVPKWKLAKQKKNEDGMDVDTENGKAAEDPEQERIKAAVESITGAADQLLTRGQTDIYDQEREALVRQWSRETGESWVEPPKEELISGEAAGDAPLPTKMWEYRWIDGRDGAAKQGPFDGQTMSAWQDAGYFGEGVEFRRAGEEGGWSRVVSFL